MIDKLKPLLLDPSHEKRSLLALVFLAGVAVYLNGLPGTFVGDDYYIVLKSRVVNDFDLKAILTTDYWQGARGFQATGTHRPLTVVTFALNNLVAGQSAFAYRLVNILLNAAVGTLMLAFLAGLGIELWAALAAALLFAVHPLHCEVIGTIVGRAEILATGFILLALWADGRDRPWSPWVVCLSFAGALASKENGLLLLPLLYLTQYQRGGSLLAIPRERAKSWASLVGVTLLWAGYRLAFLPGEEAGYYLTDNPLMALDALGRFSGALAVQAANLWKFIVPTGYHHLYAAGDFVLPTGLAAQLATLLAGLGALALAGWAALKRRPEGYAAAVFVGGGIISSNLLMITGALYAERLQYLASVGLSLLAALALARLGRARTPLLALILAGLALVTLQRNGLYREPVKLYEDVVAKSPGNLRALNALAVEHQRAGRYEEAEKFNLLTVGLDSDILEGYTGLANFYFFWGKPEKAMEWAMRCPRKEDIPLIYAVLARGAAELGDFEASQRWIDADPNNRVDSNVVYAQAIMAEAGGDLEGALAAYDYAQNQRPSPQSTRRYATLLMRGRQWATAREVLTSALDKWRTPELLALLAHAQAGEGRMRDAAATFREAAALEPQNPAHLENAARVESGGRWK